MGKKKRRAAKQPAKTPTVGQRPKYPMPCPGCHRLIDARQRYCPYCNIDTDKKLFPARVVFMFVALGLLFLAGYLIRQCR